MDSQKALWKFISTSLKRDLRVMLLMVVESNGSSPGREGFAMAVNSAGEMNGSIGGGIMEHKFVELAKDKLNEEKSDALVRKQFHDKTSGSDQSGMICSGDQTIVMKKIYVADAEKIKQIIDLLEAYITATITITTNKFIINGSATNSAGFNINAENEWSYVATVGHKHFSHIIGGGHCSLALSTLLRNLGFHVSVYDDRVGLNTMEENSFAHVKKLVDDYSQLSDLIQDDANGYVVIMTFGYRTDDIALRSIIGKQFKYLGILGSVKKMEALFNQYKEEGFSEESLSNIHTPIGVPIKSQTPWEIAVSIAAQIIMVKNEATKRQ